MSSIEISVPFLFLQVRPATEMSWMAYLESNDENNMMIERD